MRWPTELVVERHRPGRRRAERTCYCSAARYPHRVGTVPDCCGDLICAHGLPMYGHPGYEERCPECDWEEAGDIAFDWWHDEHGL